MRNDKRRSVHGGQDRRTRIAQFARLHRMRGRADRGHARGSCGGDPAGGGGRMPGTGPAPDHGGNAVALRRVMAALRPMLVATRSAKVERRSNILSRYAGRFTRLPFFGKFESLRADVERWGWMRSALIRVVSVLRRCAGLYIYRINVRPLAARSSPPCLPSGITVRVVLADELLKAADDPDLDLSPDFVRDALARGDMAFGAFEDGR